MTIVNVHEAKTHLSWLIARVVSGEEVIIARGWKAVAKLVPIDEPRQNRVPGLDVGKIWIAEDFDAPLPWEVLEINPT